MSDHVITLNVSFAADCFFVQSFEDTGLLVSDNTLDGALGKVVQALRDLQQARAHLGVTVQAKIPHLD